MTRARPSEPASNAPIEPANVRYIKLGRANSGAQACIADGVIGLGFSAIPHPPCAGGDWDKVSELLKTRSKSTAVAANRLREIRDFYELGADTLWITFADDLLWWAFSRPQVRWHDKGDGLPRTRETLSGWRSSSISGAPLRLRDLSTKLTSVARYQGTLCAVDREASYLLRRINDEPEPLALEASRVRNEMLDVATRLTAALHWRDFEILVDLIFAASGWRRLGVLGETQADLDLMLEQIATGERAFVQVKSQATPAVLRDSMARLRSIDESARIFFVCHSPSPALEKYTRAPGVDLWFADALAQRALRAGLFDWLVARVR